MILDFRNMGPQEREFLGGRVLVDGLEIKQAWYIDTLLGVVKTYDIAGDDHIHLRREPEMATLLASDPAIETLGDGGLLSKTILGELVEVFRADEDKPQ